MSDKPFGFGAKFYNMTMVKNGNQVLVLDRTKCDWPGLTFPGGKVEKGETKEDALVRECREELGITVSVGEVFFEVEHEYPDIYVHLTLFDAAIAEGVPEKLEHNDIRWITKDEIGEFAFCPADTAILKAIKEKR